MGEDHLEKGMLLVVNHQNKLSKRILDIYDTASDSFSSLNSDSEWISYDSSKNVATIASVGDFFTHCKSASKSVGPFDSLSKSQVENKLFGIDVSTFIKHFDNIMARNNNY